MRSVADDLRRESAQRVDALTATERIALALQLGDDDVARYQAAHGASAGESRAVFRRARAAGRLASASNDPQPR